MLHVHAYHLKTSPSDNYFRVQKGTDSHVFPFSSENQAEARWASEESYKLLHEPPRTRSVRSLWKSHPDFRTVELVGEGGQIDDTETLANKKNAFRRERALASN